MKYWPSHTATATAAAAQATEMIATLSMAFAVRADRDLRDILGLLAGVQDGRAFALGQAGRQPWLVVDGPTVVAQRYKPDLPAADLAGLLSSDGRVANALKTALARTSASADAAGLVGALYGREIPTRQTFRRLQEWTPLLELGAYGGAAALVASLDDIRPQILAAINDNETPRDPRILRHWWQVNALANLTLLAADPGARPWLFEMADQFVWTNWTPTFSLLRERTIWLAACAARSAAAFGEPVVAKYLRSLDAARSPFKAFDALFGLAAIGLASPTAAPSIMVELRALRRSVEGRHHAHADIFQMAYVDAIAVLAGEGAAEREAALDMAGLKWRSNPHRGLATRAAMREDPASFTATGRFLGFAILPTVLGMLPENFYPQEDSPRSERQLGMRDAVEAVRRAWLPTDEPARTMH